MVTVEQARQVLREAGFQTANLWHIDDVKSRFECSDEDAMSLLEEALQSDSVIEYINEYIEQEGEVAIEEGEDFKRIEN